MVGQMVHGQSTHKKCTVFGILAFLHILVQSNKLFTVLFAYTHRWINPYRSWFGWIGFATPLFRWVIQPGWWFYSHHQLEYLSDWAQSFQRNAVDKTPTDTTNVSMPSSRDSTFSSPFPSTKFCPKFCQFIRLAFNFVNIRGRSRFSQKQTFHIFSWKALSRRMDQAISNDSPEAHNI